MAESLWDAISPHFETLDAPPDPSDGITLQYLDRLSTLSLAALTSTETEALTYDANTLSRSLHALAKRSSTSICTSDNSLSHLHSHVPNIVPNATAIASSIPHLESATASFTEKYSTLTDNALLSQRKRLMRLGENVDRLSDMLELPTLLSSVITSATSSTLGSSTGSSTMGKSPISPSTAFSNTPTSSTASYTTALDLHTHIRRLTRLYPSSVLVRSIASQAEDAMKDLTSQLISSLRSQHLKLAGAMRLVGLLRRVAPDMDDASVAVGGPSGVGVGSGTKPWALPLDSAGPAGAAGEGALGSLFLVCRLSNLDAMLGALGPLRELADQETERRLEKAEEGGGAGQKDMIRERDRDRDAWAAGQQTERYLKRYIEVFREQCFAAVSMYKSVFPASLPLPTAALSNGEIAARSEENKEEDDEDDESMADVPPVALATFVPHVTGLLFATLQAYLPNVRDRGSRDSLLTQVLYCSASLGRLGGEFGMLLALLEEEEEEGVDEDGLERGDKSEKNGQVEEEEEEEAEWLRVMKKHRVQAGRLEMLASGAGAGGGTAGSRIVSQEVPAVS